MVETKVIVINRVLLDLDYCFGESCNTSCIGAACIYGRMSSATDSSRAPHTFPLSFLAVFKGLTVSLSILFLFTATISFRNALEPNTCGMSYSIPTFTLSALASHPRFAIYSYSDAQAIRQTRQNIHPLSPYFPIVLFVPGNAGSFKQARSIASAILRRVPTAKAFTLDLGEDPTAFGGLMQREQVIFVQACLKAILEKEVNLGSSQHHDVYIIAHSYGGIIARAAAASLVLSKASSLSTSSSSSFFPLCSRLSSFLAHPPFIVTLGAPYHGLAFVPDPDVIRVLVQASHFPSAYVLSVVGGARDWQVSMASAIGANVSLVANTRSENCFIDSVTECEGVNRRDAANRATEYLTGPAVVSTGTMRGVRRHCDHQALLWCREVVDSLAELIAERVHSETRLIQAKRKRSQGALSDSIEYNDKNYDSAAAMDAHWARRRLMDGCFGQIKEGDYWRGASHAHEPIDEVTNLHQSKQAFSIDGESQSSTQTCGGWAQERTDVISLAVGSWWLGSTHSLISLSSSGFEGNKSHALNEIELHSWVIKAWG